MKKINTTRALSISLIIILSGCLSLSCTRDRNHPGYAYFPDMVNSIAYDYYMPNANFKDGKTAQIPVAGTIPRGIIPYTYPRTFEGQQQAGIDLLNPDSVTEENISRGKEVFDIYCALCHGVSGKGDGHLFTSGKFIAKPADFTSPQIKSKPDGEKYHVITVGSLSGLMGAHGGQIKPADRWHVVTYIKSKLN